MKALILAAGRGTRLAPLTDGCPKPMLPIAGVPMVERIMASIAAQTPVREFVLVTGYRADVVHSHFGDGARWGWRVEYVHQPVPQGVGAAAQCACEPLSDGPFLMTYGDIMLDPSNYGRFAAAWAEAAPRTPPPPPLLGAEAASGRLSALVGLNWVDDPYRGAAVYLDEAQRVTRMEEKPAPGTATTHWNNAGLFVFDPLIFDYTARLQPSRRGELELPDALSAMIGDGHHVQGLPLVGEWRDVGTLEDYAAIQAEYGAKAT